MTSLGETRKKYIDCLDAFRPALAFVSELEGSQLLNPFHSSRSDIILGEHLSGALIQLLRATYFFEARQQIVRP